MCTFGLSGCRVKPRRPHQTGPPGLAHDSPRTPNVHISGPRRFKHHQNSTKGPQERERRKKIVAEEGKKSGKCWAPHPSGLHPSGLHPSGLHPSRLHPSGLHPLGPTLRGLTLCRPNSTSKNWPKSNWPKSKLAEVDRAPLDDPGGWRTGWQHEAASRVERYFRDTSLMPRLNDTEMALLRSQSGPLSGAALSTAPTCFHTRIESHLFRLLLLRRLRLPHPPSCVPVCRCGRPLDSFGHHRAGCPRAGLLARRGFAVEMAAAKVCREAGARVTTNVLVRDDLGVPHPALDEGLPLFGGVQLALDTTLLSPSVLTALRGLVQLSVTEWRWSVQGA